MTDSGDWIPRPDPTHLTTQQLNREIAHLKDLNDLHFELIERQRTESKQDSQRALDTALLGAKESVAVLAETYETGHAVLVAALDEVKNRLTVVEATANGASGHRAETLEARSDSRGSVALWISAANVFLLILITAINEIVVHAGH